MKRRLSFSEYRTIDLAILGGILFLFELLIVSAATKWFPEQPFTVSLAAAIVSIVMMRWGAYAAIHAALAGLFFCFFSSASSFEHFAIYCIGNLFAMLSLLLINYFGKERIRSDKLLTLFFAFCTQAFMLVGRALVALVFGHSFGECLAFITTDALSIIFTMVIVWIVRNLDGVFEDQKSYLLRLQDEGEKERGEH